MRTLVTNGRVLAPGGELLASSVLIEDGKIAAIDSEDASFDKCLDAEGCLVLSGIVDLHGDAFERQLLPRPGVHFPTDLALLETDRQMLANGITTAFHGITYSWEPGLRGRDSALSLISEIEQLRPHLGCDTRVHLRWETFNLEGEADVVQMLSEQRIDLLAFNDHVADIREDIESGKRHKMGVYTHRTGLDADAFKTLFETVSSRADEVPEAVARLAGIAGEHGIPCASHDDDTAQTRRWYHEHGVMLSEFPVSAEVAEASRDLGNAIILGGPNVVRGGSHCNRLSASAAAGEGLCDVLTSDYYYPSMLSAAFQLIRENDMTLAQVWPLVSTNPATAAGLHDRGEIATGKRADLLIVDDGAPLPRVVTTIAAGQVVYSARALGLN